MTTPAHPEILTESEFQEILSRRPACEGVTHPYGMFGHRQDQSATWLIGAPCGRVRFCCDGWVRTWPYYDVTVCFCGERHAREDFACIPLGGDDA